MMTSNEILGAIERVAATASKNEKQALVNELSKDEQVKRVFEYAYNPFKTFGIAKMPARRIAVGNEGIKGFTDSTWGILDRLIARQLTGNDARQAVEDEINNLFYDSADLFVRIIRKDLRAGFSEGTINKAVKGLIPEFPYMRCILVKDAKLDEFDWALGVPSQEKADGMFANLDNEECGAVSLSSRQGTPFPMEPFAQLVEEAQTRLKRGTQSHGELLVRKAGVICERQIGNGILNGVVSGGAFEADEEPIYLIWDQIPLSAVVKKGKHEVPYSKRLLGIVQTLKVTPGATIALIDTRICHSLKEAYAHYSEMLGKGKEGTIIKNPNGVWRDTGSSGSKDLVKLKLEVDVDLKVVAIVPGKVGGKNEGRAGSLTCVTSDGLLQTDVTVKNDKMRDLVDANHDDWIDRIIVVRANEILEPSASNPLNSLFLPRMVEDVYRLDKTEADSLRRVRDQFESAVKAA